MKRCFANYCTCVVANCSSLDQLPTTHLSSFHFRGYEMEELEMKEEDAKHPMAKQKRQRKSKVQMKEQMEADRNANRESLYEECLGCKAIYSSSNGHSCKIAALKMKAQVNEETQMTTKEKREISVFKCFLSASLTPEDKARVMEWIGKKVEDQQNIKYCASYLLHAFIIQQLQPVSMENIAVYINLNSKEPLVLEIDQNTCKMATSLCSQGGLGSKQTSPLTDYYENTYSKGIDNIINNYASKYLLSGSSLQYCARQMLTSFENMMVAQIWTKTKYWMRQELKQILQEEGIHEMFRKEMPQVMQPMRYWLVTHLACDKHLQLLSEDITTEDQMRDTFLAAMSANKSSSSKYFQSDEKVTAWSHLWNRMYQRFIRTIHTILIPMEWRASQTKAEGNVSGCKTEHIDGNEEIHAKKDDTSKSTFTHRRCIWLFAVLKRLEQLDAVRKERHEANVDRMKSLGTTGTVTRTYYPLKLYHLFPLPSFVPGHIRCDQKMLMAMDTDFYKQQNFEDYVVTPPPPSQGEWKRYFSFEDTFWLDKTDPLNLRACSAIITDGKAVGFEKERLKRGYGVLHPTRFEFPNHGYGELGRERKAECQGGE